MKNAQKNQIKTKLKVKKNVKISVSSLSSTPLIDTNEDGRYSRGIEHVIDQNLYNY